MASAYAEVEKRGYNKGVEYGKAQMKNAFSDGENKGISDTRKENAGRMLKAGKLSDADISAYTGLSIAEVEDLKNHLK